MNDAASSVSLSRVNYNFSKLGFVWLSPAMASENTTIAPEQRLERRISSLQTVFQGERLRFGSFPVEQRQAVGDPSPKTRELSGFIDGKMFLVDRERFFQVQAIENRRGVYENAVLQKRNCAERRNWRESGNGRKSGGLQGEEDFEDVEDDEDVFDGQEDCIISANRFRSSDHPYNADHIDVERLKQHAASELSAQQRMDTVTTGNGPGSTLRKEARLCESVRSILSDPFTGELMDDAIIFPCGHSFGSGGLQHSLQKKACYICSRPITEDSKHRNLTLRAAVAAFRREETVNNSLKRRRDRFEEKADFNDSDHLGSPSPRSRGLSFSVADRVMIVEIVQGNKRTPQRFVGCEAIITAQCLNGWYVVKTSDTAESVKLQYRSLAKVPDDRSRSTVGCNSIVVYRQTQKT